MTIIVEDFGMVFTIINVYDPSQDRNFFWDNLLDKYFTKERNFIMRGELNFSMGPTKYWGNQA
jgi:hypothetical protein